MKNTIDSSDLISDILGDDLASNYSEEVCGGKGSEKSGRSGKSSLSSYDGEKMRKYKQKYLNAI